MGFCIVHGLHEKSWEWASTTPTGKAVKAAEEGISVEEVPKAGQEQNCWSLQNRISYLQSNSAMLPGTNKTLQSHCWRGKEGCQNLLAWLGHWQQKPWKWAVLSHMFSILKGKRKGAAAPVPSSSCSEIHKHSVDFPLIFKMTFPCVALQILSTGHRWMHPHRQVFSSCVLWSLRESRSSKQSFSLSLGS